MATILLIKTKANIQFAVCTDVCGQIQICSNGAKETSGQLLAIAFSDFLMSNRESNSSLVSLLNAEEHVSRKEATKLSFLTIRINTISDRRWSNFRF